ncbi:MAG TPA: phage holin, LLH family [Ktedonobacteraceae bacterium]|nr:phage holin, LLH family [Ktedonobacteraceae bacterium]
MSPSVQIALLLLPIMLPLFISLSALLYQHLLQKLPEKRRAAVEQVVHTVVSAVEQASTTLEGPAKKAAAMEMAGEMLAYLHICVPQEILSCLIEAAVYSLRQGNERA